MKAHPEVWRPVKVGDLQGELGAFKDWVLCGGYAVALLSDKDTRRHGDVIIGTGNQLLRHHMEIRGLGIIDVQSIFGIRSIRLQKRVEVEVNLSEWSDNEEYERVGLDEKKTNILGVEVPLVQVPITPGKNITVIAEVIALHYLVKVYGGFSPAERLNQHMLEVMKRKSAAKAWVREDTE